MHKTMFDTFIVKDILWLISRLFLFITGWKVSGSLPKEKAFVMIAAPHTSNWDLPYMLTVSFALKAKPYWMGKEQIFKFPFKGLMMWMGGIPVDRSQSNNMVEHTAHLIRNSKELIVTVPPEGTRSKVKYWKTGFYHIARLANAPIVLGFLDYQKKIGGVGPIIYPTGDIEKDMLEIKSFYKTISGKRPSEYQESK
jgi:1-acyl-sn-glycerol-3-phosphate acyltransferase